ncbi:MAG: class I tRNA ligase family protein, partial [Candidatus Paceibacterota bacterium]
MKPKKPIAYDHKNIEKKWQTLWAKSKIYKTSDTSEKPKYYVLDMFPYPSGTSLHVGHPKGFIATDIFARTKTMQGFNVLHPMGFDAFGLPAEQYAIKNKVHPSIAVKKNIEYFKKQLEHIGMNYDWSRMVDTTDPEYYHWTQWIFLQIYKHGLAFESYEPINWCPSCQTGLANEDLEDGKCERCGSIVEKKPMRQWVLRITDYAERLLKDLDATVSGIPLVIRESGEDAIKKGLPFEERKAVVCIIKHWSEDKYLCSHWKKSDWHGFIIGGIENGEDVGNAGIREVQEESGYQNIKFVRNIGKIDSKFYHAVKKVNRFAHFTAVYLELRDGVRNEMAEHEKELHDVVWLTRDEVTNVLNRDDMKYLWNLFVNNIAQQETKPLLNWPESIKESQRNWIGRSEGALISFELRADGLEKGKKVEVFTTRPDTLFGVTYIVLAPESNLVQEL